MSKEVFFEIKKREDIIHLVQDVVSHIADSNSSSNKLILLSGELGAGKTTFVQDFAKYLGVESYIKSPTFVLMKSYDVDSRILPDIKKIHHMDAYRLNEEESNGLKINDLLNEENSILFIEWPEQINMNNEKSFAVISFTVNEDESRTIKINYK